MARTSNDASLSVWNKTDCDRYAISAYSWLEPYISIGSEPKPAVMCHCRFGTKPTVMYHCQFGTKPTDIDMHYAITAGSWLELYITVGYEQKPTMIGRYVIITGSWLELVVIIVLSIQNISRQ